MMSDITEVVEDYLRPYLPEPFVLHAIEWEKFGGDMVLRILVDRLGGITIDETGELSELISPLLDRLSPDPFPKEGYLLEVASPGAERPLKKPEHFKEAIGEFVFVKLYQKLDGIKEFSGDAVDFDGHVLTLDVLDKTRHKTVVIPFELISKAQTMVKF
ncbi:ribosome maturation factor RimP [Lactococcus hircilactis]